MRTDTCFNDGFIRCCCDKMVLCCQYRHLRLGKSIRVRTSSERLFRVIKGTGRIVLMWRVQRAEFPRAPLLVTEEQHFV